MGRPGTEPELQKWLAAKLGLREVPQWLWRRLEGRSYITDVLESGTPEELQDLLEEARSLMQMVRAAEGHKPRPGRRSGPRVETYLSAEEIKRSEVFSEHLARLAAEERGVVRFREQISGGKALTPDQAEALLASPAPYLLAPQVFEERGIPFVGHSARATRKRTRHQKGAWLERIALKIAWGRASASFNFSIPRTVNDGRWLDLPHNILAKTDQYPVMNYSVFGELKRLSSSLTGLYPWLAWDATWFVLTGAAPPVPPVQPGIQRRQGEQFARVVYTIAVEPWVSAKSVERIYRAYQRAILGRDNRPLGLRGLAVFSHVMSHWDQAGHATSWPDQMQEWNRDYPSWRYVDYRRFYADFHRVEQALVSPRYKHVS